MIVRIREKIEGKNRHRDTSITVSAGKLSLLFKGLDRFSNHGSRNCRRPKKLRLVPLNVLPGKHHLKLHRSDF